MKPIYIRLGKLPGEYMSVVDSVTNNVAATNVGNMIFQYAVAKTLSVPGTSLHAFGHNLYPSMVSDINRNANIVVLPLSNVFRPEFGRKLDIWADAIQRLKVPVVVVGVGCQAGIDYNFSDLDCIRKSAKNFVSSVLDRSESIGVRGEFTYEYLRKLGFRDVDVIGCPSMFAQGPNLPAPRTVNGFSDDTRLTVNISSYGEQAKHTRGLERVGEIIAAAVNDYQDVEYVPQELRSLRDLLRGHESTSVEHAVIPHASYFKMYARGKVVTFVDPSTWIQHLSGRDFVFGTRLHGVIASLLAGTPAHLLAHDSRTIELAQYFRIPHTDIRKLDSSPDPASLYNGSDYTEMMRGHRGRFERYQTFLRKNHLPDVFAEEDSGECFESRIREAELAPPIVSAPVGPDAANYKSWACSIEKKVGENCTNSSRIRKLFSRRSIRWASQKYVVARALFRREMYLRNNI